MQKYLIIIALFFITLSNEVKAEEKISIVNMELLLEKSIAGKSIKSKLEKINKKNQKYFEKKENELKKKEDDILKQKNVISKEEYVKNVSLFQKEVQTYRQEKNKRNNNLSKIKIDHVNELLKQLSPLIANFSKENNISVVIDKKFTIVSKIEADITVKLIKILDSKIKKIDVN
ncbi:OmpH family outer membrane protein [Candidatus Pelagibacter sp.]|nr:OmpH family outer membrane protein [Candidatus Pelagibacter sp.]